MSSTLRYLCHPSERVCRCSAFNALESFPTPVILVPNVNPGFSPCIMSGILNFSAIMYVDEYKTKFCNLYWI